jgi:ferredoxin-NADP reductase
MIGAADYRRRRKAGETGAWDHRYRPDTDSPVVQVEITDVERLTNRITRYVFAKPDGAELPLWEAGAHIDVVITPDTIRQYSLMSDPSDRSRYEIAVQREEDGRGGSVMAHRIFAPGRKLFVSKPINHFPLISGAKRTFLMGGGIGITPMIAMGHELFRKRAVFELHYSVTRREDAAFAEQLMQMPWAGQASVHISEDGGRADFSKILAGHQTGYHVYTCGPESYMTAVTAAAAQAGFPETARHLEYFAVPETPGYQNFPFTLVLESGRRIEVAADQTAAGALLAAGIHVDLKCSDGLCGVCKCRVLSGEVEHRDFVLSADQRRHNMILCQSRAASPDGEIRLQL